MAGFNRLLLAGIVVVVIAIAAVLIAMGMQRSVAPQPMGGVREAITTNTTTPKKALEPIEFKLLAGYGIRTIADIGVAFGVFEKCGLELVGGGSQDIGGRRVIAPYIIGGRPEPIIKGDAYGGFLPTLLSLKPIKEGAPLKIVASLSDRVNPIIVVRKDLNITKPEDLRGLRIATTQPGFPPHLALLNLLSRVGLSEKDVEIISISGGPLGPTVVELMKKGQVDAASLPPQEAAYVLVQGVARRLEIAVSGEKVLFTAVIVNSEWASKNREAVVRLLCATDEILRIIRTEDPEKIARALLENTPSDISEYYRQLGNKTTLLYIQLLRNDVSTSVDIDPAAVQNIISIAEKLGIASGLSVNDVFDPTYLRIYSERRQG